MSARQVRALELAEPALKLGAAVCLLAMAGMVAWRTLQPTVVLPRLAPPAPEVVYAPITPVKISDSVSESESEANGFILIIETEPDGADVVIDGESKGESPASVTLDCKPGARLHLELKHRDYETVERVVICKKDVMLVMKAALEKLPGAKGTKRSGGK